MEISQHFRAILCFVECARLGSFAAAARKMGISASAVSKNIASLEKVINIRLMNRTTRSLTLTEEGLLFLSQSEIAIQALDNAVNQVVTSQSSASGHIRLSTSLGFGHRYLLPLLPKLKAQYPALSLEIDFDDRVTDIITDGYDIVIRGGHILDSSLIARPICKMPLVLVASPEYLAANGIPQSPDHLSRHKLIARRFLGGKVSPWSFRGKNNEQIVIEPTQHYLCLSSPEAQINAARDGLGIAQVALHQVIDDLENGRLLTLLTHQHEVGNYEMVIQYPHRAFIAPRVKMCVELLLSEFKKEPSLHIDTRVRHKFSADSRF